MRWRSMSGVSLRTRTACPPAQPPTCHPSSRLMAAIYHLLGPTLAAGFVVWQIANAFYGVMYGMLPWLAGRLGLRREAGAVGGLAGALIPHCQVLSRRSPRSRSA